MIKHIIHHSRSPVKRGLFSLFIVAVVMMIGTAGLQRFESMPWLKAFYVMSMIATGQGLSFTPGTDAGLLFVSLMAFISVGTVVAALGFIFGPFFGMLWHVGVQKLEDEVHSLKKGKGA